MTTIRILPEILSNQIAAGEVVQRPVNAVKELVENSIDAGAKSITIEIEKGGKSLIRVSDDGLGLSRDDALLAIERYATSKIFSKEDLFCISTMGFRGEALPSIASVSKFALVTRTKQTDVATRIDIAGGRLQNVSDAGAPVGTMVEVKHLFFNTPARKKFLKSDNTEVGHIADAVSGMALGNPDIQFRLFINGRLQKSFSLNDDLFQRSIHVLGKDVAGKLYTLDFSQGPVRIHGYSSNPLVTRSTSSRIFLYVNNRLVYDRGIISAIFRGYKGRIMKGRFPLGVFFIDIDFDQVDVNVHPSKREIKFFNAQQVYQATAQAIREVMLREQEDVSAYSSASVTAEDNLPVDSNGSARPVKKIETYAFYDSDYTVQKNLKIEEQSCLSFPTVINQSDRQSQDCNQEEQAPSVQDPPAQHKEEQSYQAKETVEPTFVLEEQQVFASTGILDQTGGVDQTGIMGQNRIIGQALGTYILVDTQAGLMIVDQHAAHERIVYEKLRHRYQTIKGQSQMLLVPQTLELNFKEANLLVEMIEDLKALGVIIEPFGGTTFVIKSVPNIMEQKDVQPLIIEILETALVKKDKFSKDGWLEECLILMACHGAIRANLNLALVEMEKLIDDLEKCENPRHCPHGRPIMIFWDKNQIEKLFKRVV